MNAPPPRHHAAPEKDRRLTADPDPDGRAAVHDQTAELLHALLLERFPPPLDSPIRRAPPPTSALLNGRRP